MTHTESSLGSALKNSYAELHGIKIKSCLKFELLYFISIRNCQSHITSLREWWDLTWFRALLEADATVSSHDLATSDLEDFLTHEPVHQSFFTSNLGWTNFNYTKWFWGNSLPILRTFSPQAYQARLCRVGMKFRKTLEFGLKEGWPSFQWSMMWKGRILGWCH